MRIFASFLVVVGLLASVDAFQLTSLSTSPSTRSSTSTHHVRLQMSSSSHEEEHKRFGLRTRVWNKAKQPILSVWNKAKTTTTLPSRVLKQKKSIALIATILTTLFANPTASYAAATVAKKAVAVAASAAAGPKPCFKIVPAGMFFAAVTGASVVVGKAVLKGTRSSSGSTTTTTNIQQDEVTTTTTTTVEQSIETSEEQVNGTGLTVGQKLVDEVLERKKKSKETAAVITAAMSTPTTTEHELETNGNVAVATAVETATATAVAVETEKETLSNGHTAPEKMDLPTIPESTALTNERVDDDEEEVDEEPKKGIRPQPLSPKEEAILAAKYGQIEDIGERCYQILEDLGLLEEDSFETTTAEDVVVPSAKESSKPPQAAVSISNGYVVTPTVEMPPVTVPPSNNGHAATTTTAPKVNVEPPVVPAPVKSVWNKVIGAVNGHNGAEERKVPQFVKSQPLPRWLASKLHAKYEQIEDLAEKCYQILDDLELLQDTYP